MRRKILAPGLRRRVVMGAVAAAGVLLLGGCGAVDKLSSPAGSVLSGDFSGGKSAAGQPEIDRSIFAVQKFCPPIEVRGGAHVLSVYARGQDGDPGGLRYQAIIREWARECTYSGDTVAIKVGLVGRVVSGPAGVDGTVRLPVRIAMTGEENAVLASELVPVDVSFTNPNGTEAWSRVVDSITVPADGVSRIYIGFDEDARAKRR